MMRISACVVVALAGAAFGQTWTFEAPNFTTGELTPLVNRAPNITPGTWTATFDTPSLPMQVANFAANGLMVGNILYVPTGSTSMTIFFNQPVTDLSLDFALIGVAPGFALNYATLAGSGNVAATNVGGGAGFWGGSLSLTGLGGITAIDLWATAPTGALCEFGIDNVSVPAPGAAAALGLIGVGALRRRR